MDCKDTNKVDIINQIKTFSMPDFPHLHILSKTFFNDFFLKLYKNKNLYTVLYGDINGLRKLNTTIGFDQADLAIEELLKTILDYLPSNTTSFRVGGDEFCFVIPDLNTSQVRELTKNIHQNLLSNSKVEGLDITFGACDSTEYDNISDIYHFVENKVNLKKTSHLHLDEPVNDLADYEKKLDAFLDFTIKTYLNNFRFSSKRYFTRKDLEALSYPILNSVTNLLNSESIKPTPNKDNENKPQEEDIPNISSEMSNTLNKVILCDANNFETLSSTSKEDLEYVKNSLSIDGLTGAYNSVYRDHYLTNKLDQDKSDFQILLVESLGIKISNSVLTHAGTDKKIKYTYDSLVNAINNLVPEDSDVEIIPIHSGGGNFEFIIKNNASGIITYEDIKALLHELSLDSNNFYLLGALGNCFNNSKHDEVYSKLKKICEIKKNRIKRKNEYWVTPNALELIDISLYSLVNFFKTQSQNLGIYNEQEKISFMKKTLNSLVDNFNELNLDNEKNESNQGKER